MVMEMAIVKAVLELALPVVLEELSKVNPDLKREVEKADREVAILRAMDRLKKAGVVR